MRMLVVDDEPDIANMLAGYFRMEGFDVTQASSGAEALDVVDAACRAGAASCASSASASGQASPLDIVLLDVNMPGMDGFEVCRRIRERLGCPIIFLTARVEDADQLDGFAAGADDYVVKPFSLEVLGRRVAAHLARSRRERDALRDAAQRRFNDIVVDYAARTVEVVGTAAGPDVAARTPVPLTRLEFDLVALLSKRPGQVFDRDVIYERVWGWDASGEPQAVREHVRRVRKKFAEAGAQADPIETVWGVGYKWAAR